jgi:WD40 repeat protein
VWDIDSGNNTAVLDDFEDITPVDQWTVAWSPDDSLVVSGGRIGTLMLWDPEAGKEKIRLEGHCLEVTDAQWSPDGSRIATASEDASVQVWDAASGQRLAQFDEHWGDVWAVAWSPDGRHESDDLLRKWG